MLVDARHGVKSVDHEIMTLLDQSAVTFQVVLTKADKIKAAEYPKLLEGVSKELAKHPAAFPTMLLTSSEKGDGIAHLRATIAGLLES